MTYILKTADGTIKSYMDNVRDLILNAGESLVESELNFTEYSTRFVLSYQGKTGQVVSAKVGDAEIGIDVSVPGYDQVSVNVGNETYTVALTEGQGKLTLATGTAGRFAVTPADPTVFCAAGMGSLLVVIESD